MILEHPGVEETYKGVLIAGPYLSVNVTNNSRKKVYATELAYLYEIETKQSSGSSPFTDARWKGVIEEKLMREATDNPLMPHLAIRFYSESGWSQRFKGYGLMRLIVKVDCHFKAAKYILRDKVEMYNHLRSLNAPFDTWIIQAIKAEIDRCLDAAAAEERRQDAQVIAYTVAGQVDAKAREIVRYEQRLAALKAELAAERLVQIPHMIEAFRAKDDFTVGGRVMSQIAIEVGLKHVAEALPPIEHHCFGSEHKPVVKIEEVTVPIPANGTNLSAPPPMLPVAQEGGANRD